MQLLRIGYKLNRVFIILAILLFICFILLYGAIVRKVDVNSIESEHLEKLGQLFWYEDIPTTAKLTGYMRETSFLFDGFTFKKGWIYLSFEVQQSEYDEWCKNNTRVYPSEITGDTTCVVTKSFKHYGITAKEIEKGSCTYFWLSGFWLCGEYGGVFPGNNPAPYMTIWILIILSLFLLKRIIKQKMRKRAYT